MDKSSHDEMKEHSGIEAGFGGVEDDSGTRKAVLKMDCRCVSQVSCPYGGDLTDLR